MTASIIRFEGVPGSMPLQIDRSFIPTPVTGSPCLVRRSVTGPDGRSAAHLRAHRTEFAHLRSAACLTPEVMGEHVPGEHLSGETACDPVRLFQGLRRVAGNLLKEGSRV